MTTDFAYAAVYDVNKYLWGKLVSGGVLSASDYSTTDFGIAIVPIVPAQEIPELANHFDNKAYLVYDVMTVTSDAGNNDEWWLTKDEVTYGIYCPDYAKVTEIANCITDAMVKQDESARAIRLTAGISGKFYFHNCDVPWVDIQKGPKQEAGRFTGTIQVTYNYSNV